MPLTETLTATQGDVVRVERKCFDRNTEDTLTIEGEVTEVDGVAVASDPDWITIHSVIDGVASGRKQGRLLMDIDTGVLEAEGVTEFKVRGTVQDEHFESVDKVFTITAVELAEVFYSHSVDGLLHYGVTKGSLTKEVITPDHGASIYSTALGYLYYFQESTELWRMRPDGTNEAFLLDFWTDVDGGDPHQSVSSPHYHSQDGFLYVTARGNTNSTYTRLIRFNADGSGATVVAEPWPQFQYRKLVGVLEGKVYTSYEGDIEIYDLATMTLQDTIPGTAFQLDNQYLYVEASSEGWPSLDVLHVYDRANLGAGPQLEMSMHLRRTLADGDWRTYGIALSKGHLYLSKQDNMIQRGTSFMGVANPVAGAMHLAGDHWRDIWFTVGAVDMDVQTYQDAPTATMLEDFEAASIGSLPSGWSQPAMSRVAIAPSSTWEVTDEEVYEGTQALGSGAVSVGEASAAQWELTTAEPGYLILSAYVHSNWKTNRLLVYIGGKLYIEVTGQGGASSGWTRYTAPIPEGTTEIEVVYHKSEADSTGVDRAFVDALRFLPASQAMGSRIDFTPPSAPTNVQIDDTSGDRVITWDDPPEEFNQIILLRTFDGPDDIYEVRDVIPPGTESYTDGWSTSSDIWYRLYAEDEFYNCSEETDPIHAPPVP